MTYDFINDIWYMKWLMIYDILHTEETLYRINARTRIEHSSRGFGLNM